jgi:flavorubredoxin
MKAQAIKLNDHVYWVGAIDWGLREFHGYQTQGTTYNAYLILADKVTLVDTVKASFLDEMLERIASVIEPSRIDYIISNHSEMDHSGSLPRAIDIIKPEKVIASREGRKALSEHFSLNQEISAVGDGEKLGLGNLTLSFFETRMIHWPDSMFTYLVEDGILFSNDAFGMHLASSERFDDQIVEYVLEYEAAKYYANIILPFSNLVAKLMAKLPELNLKLKMIAPDHGPVWRTHIDKIIKLYNRWSDLQPTLKAIVTYDTMWHSTEKMALAIADGLLEGGAQPKVMPLSTFHNSDIVTEIMDSGALVVGSPTFNSGILPTVAALLSYLKGLKVRHVLGGAFGSYGWSPASVKQINEILASMRIDAFGEGVQAKYVPDQDDLARCNEFGKEIALKLKSMV